jgi:hypothetical protein
MMKFSNPDIIRITEIQQYFLEPPYTFKLYAEATALLTECIGILNKYPAIETSFYDNLDVLRADIEEHKENKTKLRALLHKTGRLIGGLNSR